jgi:hypothetical protein
MPRSSIIGSDALSRPRAVASTTRVSDVGREMLCERVAREKSSKRSRSTTVRHVRRPPRRRRARRSTMPTRIASSSSGER